MPQGKQFSRSKKPNLYRHRSGTYYAVAKVGGKTRRRALETDDYNLAVARLSGVLEELRGASESASAGTLGDALVRESMRPDPTIKPRTSEYYQQLAKKLVEVSGRVKGKPCDKHLSKVTVADLKALVGKLAEEGSATRHNGALALLRRTYQSAIDGNMIAANPAAGLKRLPPPVHDRAMPTQEDFAKVVGSIAEQGKRNSKAAALTVRFLAATGLRISEANALKWGAIDDKSLTTTTAKNGKLRRVPLSKAAKEVLRDLKRVLPSGKDDPVLPIKSPRIALDNACDRLELPRMRVHDLRHLFATRCIEAGVDMPTVANWMGHLDGGALAAREYGHLVEQHSDRQMKRVNI